MFFRAIIYTIDHRIQITRPKINGNWFTFNDRAYRVDREAVRQVINKGNKVQDLVESIYFEGNPIPKFSKMKKERVLQELWDWKHAIVHSEQPKGLFGS